MQFVRISLSYYNLDLFSDQALTRELDISTFWVFLRLRLTIFQGGKRATTDFSRVFLTVTLKGRLFARNVPCGPLRLVLRQVLNAHTSSKDGCMACSLNCDFWGHRTWSSKPKNVGVRVTRWPWWPYETIIYCRILVKRALRASCVAFWKVIGYLANPSHDATFLVYAGELGKAPSVSSSLPVSDRASAAASVEVEADSDEDVTGMQARLEALRSWYVGFAFHQLLVADGRTLHIIVLNKTASINSGRTSICSLRWVYSIGLVLNTNVDGFIIYSIAMYCMYM